MKIASEAQNLFEKRNNANEEFGRRYIMHWEQNVDQINLRRRLRAQNHNTIERLNQITNEQIAQDIGESEESEAENSTGNGSEGCADAILQQTARLASDGKVFLIVNLTFHHNQFNAVIEATNIDRIEMSEYAKELSGVLQNSTLSVQKLRENLYRAGYQKGFDLISHEDAGFIEVTARHFLDLMSSPNSPLNNIMLERTAASYLIIYIINQLFLANNDIIELGWLEREFYSTDRAKFDGVLFKVGDKTVSPAFIEFSGGLNDKTSQRKNSNDIEKLYRNLIKVMNDNKTNHMFCIRCFDHYIYFERLIKFEGAMCRKIDTTIEVPNTPRKLKAFIKQIPMIFAWKQGVVSHVLNYN
ncbi:hypothetical protein G6F56_006198 [Rhizopus delemar]|nr:hypothetical protein G6F56_006198 [Rhizopus delemar]